MFQLVKFNYKNKTKLDFISLIVENLIRVNVEQRKALTDFGEYVAECLPRFVQHVQITSTNELEILIHPDGVFSVMAFLKDHTNAQFSSLSDITAIDVPSRAYRFEVCFSQFSIGFRVRCFFFFFF